MVDQVTAEEFADRLDAGESFTIVDTRGRDSFEPWHLPGAVNVPYDPREGADDDQLDGVESAADERPVVTVCGKGLTSAAFAFELDLVRQLTADVPEKPPNYERIVGSNRGEESTEGDAEATELEVRPNNCAA